MSFKKNVEQKIELNFREMFRVDVYIYTFFTLAQNHANIFLISFMARLSIYSIANPHNTQRLQSLFELLSIKETISFQHCNMETKYVVPSCKE